MNFSDRFVAVGCGCTLEHSGKFHSNLDEFEIYQEADELIFVRAPMRVLCCVLMPLLAPILLPCMIFWRIEKWRVKPDGTITLETISLLQHKRVEMGRLLSADLKVIDYDALQQQQNATLSPIPQHPQPLNQNDPKKNNNQEENQMRRDPIRQFIFRTQSEDIVLMTANGKAAEAQLFQFAEAFNAHIDHEMNPMSIRGI